jgi:hypothetical protein
LTFTGNRAAVEKREVSGVRVFVVDRGDVVHKKASKVEDFLVVIRKGYSHGGYDFCLKVGVAVVPRKVGDGLGVTGVAGDGEDEGATSADFVEVVVVVDWQDEGLHRLVREISGIEIA